MNPNFQPFLNNSNNQDSIDKEQSLHFQSIMNSTDKRHLSHGQDFNQVSSQASIRGNMQYSNDLFQSSVIKALNNIQSFHSRVPSSEKTSHGLPSNENGL